MLEPLRKLLLAGLGTVDLTEEKLKAVMNDLVARGEVSERDARELFSGWAQRAREQRSKLQQQLDDAVQRTMERVGVCRRADLDRLEERIAELERRLPREPEVG